MWHHSPLLLILALRGFSPLAAQAPATDTARSPTVYHGLALGVPASVENASASLLVVGYQRMQLSMGRPGLDFAIGTAPRVLAVGLLNVGGRAGVSLPVSLADGVVLLPSAGVGFLGATFFNGHAGGTFGGYLGVSAIALNSGAGAIRIGVHRHELKDRELSGWLVEFAWLARRKP